MRLAHCLVTRDEHQTQPCIVPVWEVDMLRMVHGPENVVVERESFDARDYPDPADEYERLQNRYKSVPDTDDLYVARVYGFLGPACRLADLIAEAEASEDEGRFDADPDDEGEDEDLPLAAQASGSKPPATAARRKTGSKKTSARKKKGRRPAPNLATG